MNAQSLSYSSAAATAHLQANQVAQATEATQATGGTRTQMHPGKVNYAKIEKTAQDFEQVFLGQMLQHMFSGVKTDSMFGGGAGEDSYKSMMIDEYGKAMSKHGGIGIASAVRAQLIRTQEATLSS